MSADKSAPSLVEPAPPEIFESMGSFEIADAEKCFMSVRLQFAKFAHGFKPSDFEGFIRSVVGEENIVSLGRLSFPNEWQMLLSSKETRENLIRMRRTRINGRSCWIRPLSHSEVRGCVHWIPNEIPDERIKEKLRTFGDVLFMEAETQTKWNLKVSSDSRYFALYLKPGTAVDDIPHFMTICGYMGLITIIGRPPVCFHCREIGHRKTECKKFRENLSEYCMRKPRNPPVSRKRGRRHDGKAVQLDGNFSKKMKLGEDIEATNSKTQVESNDKILKNVSVKDEPTEIDVEKVGNNDKQKKKKKKNKKSKSENETSNSSLVTADPNDNSICNETMSENMDLIDVPGNSLKRLKTSKEVEVPADSAIPKTVIKKEFPSPVNDKSNKAFKSASSLSFSTKSCPVAQLKTSQTQTTLTDSLGAFSSVVKKYLLASTNCGDENVISDGMNQAVTSTFPAEDTIISHAMSNSTSKVLCSNCNQVTSVAKIKNEQISHVKDENCNVTLPSWEFKLPNIDTRKASEADTLILKDCENNVCASNEGILSSEISGAASSVIKEKPENKSEAIFCDNDCKDKLNVIIENLHSTSYVQEFNNSGDSISNLEETLKNVKIGEPGDVKIDKKLGNQSDINIKKIKKKKKKKKKLVSS